MSINLITLVSPLDSLDSQHSVLTDPSELKTERSEFSVWSLHHNGCPGHGLANDPNKKKVNATSLTARFARLL